MAHLLPYFRFTVCTQLPVDEAARLLATHVSVRRNRLWKKERGFEGVVRHTRFNINPIAEGQDAFRPYPYGRIRTSPFYGSVVQVVTTLHPLSGVLSLSMAGFLIFQVIRSFVEFTQNQNAAGGFYGFLGLTIAFYGLVMLSFWPTARAAQRFITKLYHVHGSSN